MKRLLVLFVVLFTVFFSYTIIAQEMGAVRKGVSMSFPEKVQTPLGPPLAAGTYTVGTGGNFPTIDSTFKKLSIDGIAGAVTLELINTLYTAPTDSFGFKLVGPIPGAGPSSRVTIKPAANKNVVVEGNGASVFSFINTSFLTIDGVGLIGTTTLTIHTLQNILYQWNDGVDFYFNSDHNIVQNTIIIDEDYTRWGGIGFWNPTSVSVTPDSNLIQNNFIRKSGIAILISSSNPSAKCVGNVIRGNKIGSEIDSLIGWGIQVEWAMYTIIENNIVQNINRLGSAFDIIHGINLYSCNNSTVRNNIVHHINSYGVMGSAGILLSGGTGDIGSYNYLYNNMVYNIQSTSFSSNGRAAGIQIWYQNYPYIYYNSVHLAGSGNGANPEGSAAFHIGANCTNVNARNNILINTRDESPYCASAIRAYSGFYSMVSDNNDLYYSPNQYNCLVRFGSDYHTLADWQAAGKDLNSISEMPHFIAPNNLHINGTIPTNIESHGIPIAGIDSDFDGNLRSSIKPDIGADEFDGTVVPVELTAFTASANGAEVILNWSTATELNNYGFEIQRKVSGGEFATVAFVKGQGTTTQQNQYSFADKNLDEGKYFYRLKQMDYGGQFSYSQIVEVDVRMLDNYTLEQNFPNPFNPTTTIGYVLQEKGNAKLTLLNSLGEEIAVLVNKEQDKGYHKVEFNATKLSSGVYFYQLLVSALQSKDGKAGSFVETKKMLLLR